MILCALCEMNYKEDGKHVCNEYLGIDKCECRECHR